VYTIRFDLRAPATGAPAPDLYAAALEMCGFAESRGCRAVVLCEHHTSSDGYLPSPTVFAAAVAARTTTLPIVIAVELLPLYDPIRLAEEMAVLDNLSRGRVHHTLAIGYRPVEYEMYGVDFHRRGRIADEKLALLLEAKTGEPFVHGGRRIHVTPAPYTPGGPRLSWGGGSVAAARRAGRNGLGFQAVKAGPELREAYEAAAREAGYEPGLCHLASPEDPAVVFVADDLDRAWDELGPYLMHDVRMYGSWNEGDTGTAGISFVQSAEELRAERRSHRIMTVDEAVEAVRGGSVLSLHPLIGGCPPEIAWPYLRTVTDVVMDRVAS
jgi:alkanesulfonate monooxygenase SsuD/methylene tetrahydromethanopterin reductase-like flavin-dependent oxidoreductase (luciferase family)